MGGIIIIKSPWQWGFSRLSLSLSFSLSLSLSLYLSIYLSHRFRQVFQIEIVNKFLLVSQYWHVHVKGSIRERRLWVRPCLSSSVPHALFVLLGWFLRREVSGRTIVVSWNVASRKIFFSIFAIIKTMNMYYSQMKESGTIYKKNPNKTTCSNYDLKVHLMVKFQFRRSGRGVEYSSIAITPWSTLSRSRGTFQNHIYG